MTDLLNSIATYEQVETDLGNATEVVRDQREALAAAFAGVVAAGAAADNAEIAAFAAGIIWCQAEIDRLTDDEQDGLRMLRARQKLGIQALREAARTGNASVAEAELTAVEEEVAERTAEIRDLRRALKEHTKNLMTTVRAVF